VQFTRRLDRAPKGLVVQAAFASNSTVMVEDHKRSAAFGADSGSLGGAIFGIDLSSLLQDSAMKSFDKMSIRQRKTTGSCS
jgi:hypothetical protein